MWTCPKCRQECDDEFDVCWACGTSREGVEDPSFFDETTKGLATPVLPEGVLPENLVTLAKCSLPPEAHAIRVRLESEGIPVFLFDEFTITMDWLLSNAIGGVKVQVADRDFERAQAILDAMEEQKNKNAAERAASEETADAGAAANASGDETPASEGQEASGNTPNDAGER